MNIISFKGTVDELKQNLEHVENAIESYKYYMKQEIMFHVLTEINILHKKYQETRTMTTQEKYNNSLKKHMCFLTIVSNYKKKYKLYLDKNKDSDIINNIDDVFRRTYKNICYKINKNRTAVINNQ